MKTARACGNVSGIYIKFTMRSRHSPPESLLFAEFCKQFPVLRRMSRGDRFVSDCAHHHPVSANRTFPIRRQIGPFCGDFRPLTSRILVSAGVYPFRWRFLAPCLRIQKFRSRRPALSVKSDCTSPRKSAFCVAVIRDLWLRGRYSGLRPSASNCRPHSVGGSRSRSMLVPSLPATFYGCLNKIECEEGERDGHIGLPNVTFFASARLSDHGYPKNHTQVPRLHNCSIKAKSGQDDLFRAQRKAR